MVIRELWSVDRNVRATSAVKGEEVGREVEGFELRNESKPRGHYRALGRRNKSGSICQAAGNYDMVKSPDVHDRAVPERVHCRLTCRKEWSMYFYKVVDHVAWPRPCFCNPNIRDVVKRIRMIGIGLGRSSRRYGL